MKVYLLRRGNYGSERPWGIFSTREEAERVRSLTPDDDMDDEVGDVEEFEVIESAGAPIIEYQFTAQISYGARDLREGRRTYWPIVGDKVRFDSIKRSSIAAIEKSYSRGDGWVHLADGGGPDREDTRRQVEALADTAIAELVARGNKRPTLKPPYAMGLYDRS